MNGDHEGTTGSNVMYNATRILAVILSAFVVLGFIYSLATPVFEASDEISHYPVVKYIADGYGLPVQDPRNVAAWEQEGSQPPLYYALAALATAWINTDDMPAIRWRNPFSNIGVPLSYGNKNLVVHTSAEAFPWRGTVLAIYLIRYLSLLLQVTTVLLTFLIAREIWPEREELALFAAALVAFNPMFLFIAASVNNDNLIVPLATLVIWLLIRMLKDSQVTWRRLALLGLLLAASALTKLSGLGLFFVSALVLARIAGRRKAWRAWLGWVGLLAVMAVVIAGWWYWRNWRLYGDPTGLNVMLEIAGRRAKPASWQQLLDEFEGFRMSFWGVFGGFNLVAPRWVYRVYDGLMLAALLGWGVLAWRRRGRRWSSRLWPVLVLAVWVLILVLALLRWTSQTLASQGRLIFPGIAAVSVLLAYGLAGWAVAPARRRIAVGVSAVGFLLAAAMPFWVIRPAYVKPPLIQADQVPATATKSDLTFAGKLRLLAHEMPVSTVRPGDRLPVTLYWQLVTRTDQNHGAYVHLLGRQLRPVGQVNTYPGQGAYPLSLLNPGEVVRDVYRVPIAITATAPSLVRVEVGLFDYGVNNDAPLPVHDSAGAATWGVINTVRLVPVEPPVYEISRPERFELGGQAMLLGSDLSADTVMPGQAITLTLYWQAQARIAEDYHVFVHLVGPQPGEHRVAQGDQAPLNGDWPTWAWEPGQIVRDDYPIALPTDLQPGRYELRAGLYRLSDGWRLPVQGSTGRVKDSAAVVGEIWVR